MTAETTDGPTGPPPKLFTGPRLSVPGQLARMVFPAFAAAMVILENGFSPPPLPLWLLRLIQVLAIVAYGLQLIHQRRRRLDPFVTRHSLWLEILIALSALFGILAVSYTGHDAYWRFVECVAVVFFLMEAWRLNVTLSRLLARPSLLLPLSFASLILIGTILLMTPRATPHAIDPVNRAYIATAPRVTASEALFTATSAVCVTGLTLRNTAHDFSPFGQVIIGSLIQLGGLGIIIFGSMFAGILGRGLSLKEDLSLKEMLNDQPLHRVRGFVRFIVLTTIGVELIGAAMMYPLWIDPADGPLSVQQRIGMSLFHAASAFCNAGFDITGESLVGYRHSFLTHGIIAPLIVIGGLGFPALENLFCIARYRIKRWLRYQPVRPNGPVDLTKRRLSLHTKIVLATTLALYLWGLVLIGTAQLVPFLHEPMQQAAYSPDHQEPLTFGRCVGLVADASFMSITSRTAGFNAIPMQELQPAGSFTIVTLMMVGGSPGSTAGGAKTAVLALLVLSVVATVRQRPRTEAFGRTIADALVRKAATIGLCYLLLVTTGTLLLCFSEPLPFKSLMFEVVSASTTTGLSLGATGELSGFGRAVIIACMFLGRVGPLALLSTMSFSKIVTSPYRYAYENVALG